MYTSRFHEGRFGQSPFELNTGIGNSLRDLCERLSSWARSLAVPLSLDRSRAQMCSWSQNYCGSLEFHRYRGLTGLHILSTTMVFTKLMNASQTKLDAQTDSQRQVFGQFQVHRKARSRFASRTTIARQSPPVPRIGTVWRVDA